MYGSSADDASSDEVDKESDKPGPSTSARSSRSADRKVPKIPAAETVVARAISKVETDEKRIESSRSGKPEQIQQKYPTGQGAETKETAAVVTTSRAKSGVVEARSAPTVRRPVSQEQGGQKPVAKERSSIPAAAITPSKVGQQLEQPKSGMASRFGARSPEDHLSLACHLFPRLSESNLQFHDIYWNWDDGNKMFMLRKRKVKVNKIVKAFYVRYEPNRPLLEVESREFVADLSLIDRRPFANRQIVSNAHCATVPLQTGRLTLRNRGPSGSVVLVRSNYALREVALQLALRQKGSMNILGQAELELLNEQGESALQNRMHSYLFGNLRFTIEVADVPQRQQMQSDSLPDVLICEESWVPMLAAYRQVMCERLATEADGDRPKSVWISDPLLATFPEMLEDKQLTEAFVQLLNKKNVMGQRDPATTSQQFRQLYMDYILPLLSVANRKDRESWFKERLNAIREAKAETADSIKAIFVTEQCRPLDIFEFSQHLSGSHAID